MSTSGKANSISLSDKGFQLIAGIALILAGLIILTDQYLKIGWLWLLIAPLAGLIFLIGGIRARWFGITIAGCILVGLGVSSLLGLSPLLNQALIQRISLSLLIFGAGWIGISLISLVFFDQFLWWPLIPGCVIAAAGLATAYSPFQWLNYVLFIPAALGLVFLGWGTTNRLFGLIIPGCLLVGIGPGIFYAWARPGEPNSLAQTGIMLVVFAMGWGLITLFSRVTTQTFIWWPLIPAGILAVVGWGLYLGGNPDNALSFIGNTGSIGLIIFGAYLLLWRKGLRP